MTTAAGATQAPPQDRPRLSPTRLPRPRTDPGRHALGPERWRLGVLAGMAGLLVVVGLAHEPWFDEAQAWLVARDDSLWDLLSARMRHEGTTPLWHLALLLPAKAGLPYRTMSVISGVAALAATWLIVRHAPFPRWLRATLPFCYFTLYQYGVIARSYCLLAPLLLAAAIAFPHRRERPWRWTLPLAGLAAVSVHGLIIGACWEADRLLELRREWPSLNGEERRRRLLPGLLVGAVIGLAIIELWPSADTSGGGTWHLDLTALGTLVSSPGNALVCGVTAAGMLASLPWMARRGVVSLFALPSIALLAFFTVRYFSPWHAGALYLLWLATLWMGWRRVPRPGGAPALRPDRLLGYGLGGVLAGQLLWSAQSISFDLSQPYSGAPALAAYIKDNHLEGRIDADGKYVVAALPYFDRTVFADYRGGHGPGFYPWSRSDDPLPSTAQVRRRRADAIVLAVESRSEARVRCLYGYRLDAIFPGHVLFGGGRFESETYVVFRRDPTSTARTSQTCVTIPA